MAMRLSVSPGPTQRALDGFLAMGKSVFADYLALCGHGLCVPPIDFPLNASDFDIEQLNVEW
jgi:hypothetical protein